MKISTILPVQISVALQIVLSEKVIPETQDERRETLTKQSHARFAHFLQQYNNDHQVLLLHIYIYMDI